MAEDIILDFDTMEEVELGKVGSKSKFKPTKTEVASPKEEMPSNPTEDEEEVEMPEKPLREEVPEKTVEEEKSARKSEENLEELGSKIDELMSEDAELRSVLETMTDEEKVKIVKRLKAISKEYDELVEKVNKRISKMKISDKEIDEMSQENIVKELNHLKEVNSELRRVYSLTSNPELEFAIEEALNKLNARYNVLVDAYNSKNEKTM